MLLHKQSRHEGLLSLHVSPVCPRIETNSAATETKAVSEENIAAKSQVHVNQVQLKEDKDGTRLSKKDANNEVGEENNYEKMQNRSGCK